MWPKFIFLLLLVCCLIQEIEAKSTPATRKTQGKNGRKRRPGGAGGKRRKRPGKGGKRRRKRPKPEHVGAVAGVAAIGAVANSNKRMISNL